MTPQEEENIIKAIYDGTITLSQLPKAIYNLIAVKLDTKVLSAFSLKFGKKVSINNPDFEIIQQLRKNIYEFSGAKTWHEVRDIQSIMFNEQGFKRSIDEVIKEGKDILTQYNQTYLRTEVNTAGKQARSAKKWQSIQENKELFPLLQYQTVADARVRPDHAVLDNVIKPVDDPFWDTFTPPNGWNCRCITIQLRSGEVTPDEDFDLTEAKQQTPELFQSNPGKAGHIFDKDKHPYFTNLPNSAKGTITEMLPKDLR